MKPPARPSRGRTKKLPIAAAVGSFAFEGLIAHDLKSLGFPRASVSLRLCGDAESRRLNRAYRRQDKPTDILSFPAMEAAPSKGFRGHLGDLALNLDYAWRRRGRFSKDFDQELAFLVLHGLLHLIGVHHDTRRDEARMHALMRRHFPPPLKHLAPLRGPVQKAP
jgi:probable rRNA maturation factor